MPHLLDRIFEFAPHASLIALRAVNHTLRKRADARLAEHLILRWHLPGAESGGMYFYARGSSPGPHGVVGAEIALPGFAFLPKNELRPDTEALDMARRQLASRRRGHPTNDELYQRAKEVQVELERRKKFVPRATQWCEAAIAHTRVLDLTRDLWGDSHVFWTFSKLMTNLVVVRSPCGVRGQLCTPKALHLIMSTGAWDDGHLSSWVHNYGAQIQNTTLFVNVEAGRSNRRTKAQYERYPCPGDITVVFRPIPAARPGTRSTPGHLRWDTVSIRTLLSGGRYTFVNISEATHRVVGVKDRQGTDGAYEAAFMSALEESVLSESTGRESPEGLRDLVRRGVRVLSLDQWMVEATKEDREAYVDFL